MRVRVIFKLKNRGANLPFHHQFVLANFISGIIKNSSEGKFNDFEFYNFSGLKGQTRINKNGLHYYSNYVTLVLSSPNQEFIDFLLKEIFDMPEIELGELILQPETTELEEVDEMDKEMKYICISPLIAIQSSSNSNHDKRLVSPESDEFSDLLYESTMERMEDSMRFSKEEMNAFNKFQFVPDQGYLKKLKERDKKFARTYAVNQNEDRYEVRGYTLPFKLHAVPAVQQFIFNCGLGNYTDKGFGMLDLANVGTGKKTTPYTFSKTELS